jgi:hypothetical protein
MTCSEYARYRKLTPGYVSQLKSKGVLVMAGNRVDVKATDARLAELSRVRQKVKDNGFYASKVRKERAIADMRELDLRERKGELVNRARTLEEFSERVIACRSRLMGIGHMVAPIVDPEDRARITEFIDSQIAAALEELSRRRS